jgi:type I restriction enzyme S subunit
MTDWPVKTLGDMLEVSIGGIWGSEVGEDEVDVFVYRSTELIKDGQLKEELTVQRSITTRQLDSRKLEVGDLLLEKSGGGPKTPVGRVGLVKTLAGLSVCSNFMQLMRPRKNDILPTYLHYFLNHFHVSGRTEDLQSNSTNIRNLKTTEYMELEIPVPPLEEQKRIVALLDEATARVTECQEVTLAELRLASDLYQARIEELLSAHALRDVREVELATVIDLVIDHRGKTPNKLGGDFTDSGVPVVSAIHIKDDSIKWSERYRFVTHEMFERWMPERLMKGDILLTSEAPLGQVARIESDEPLVLSQRLFALRAKGSLVSGDYLFEFLRSPLGQDRLKDRATGATAVGIRQAELMKVMVPVPSLEDQPEMIHQIHAARQTVLELKSQLQGRELLLKDLRQSILEAAFAGEL